MSNNTTNILFNPLDLYPDYDPELHIIIPLTKGLYTIIDVIDADLAKLNWCASVHTKAYAVRKSSRARTTERLHRVILSRMVNKELERKDFCDHINQKTLDNRRGNLRVVSNQQNMHNVSVYANNKSGCKGVSWNKSHRKWISKIMINGKYISLGDFDTPEQAYFAYCQAAIELQGEFAPQYIRDYLAQQGTAVQL